jgi:hypothetical protein
MARLKHSLFLSKIPLFLGLGLVENMEVSEMTVHARQSGEWVKTSYFLDFHRTFDTMLERSMYYCTVVLDLVVQHLMWSIVKHLY